MCEKRKSMPPNTIHWSRVFCNALLRVMQNLLIKIIDDLVKVVEGQLIYNFAIDPLVHFCFEILSNRRSNSAMLNWKTGRAPVRATSLRCSRPAASACRRTGRTRTPSPTRVQWSVRCAP
jgi:hypothetical protein